MGISTPSAVSVLGAMIASGSSWVCAGDSRGSRAFSGWGVRSVKVNLLLFTIANKDAPGFREFRGIGTWWEIRLTYGESGFR